MKNKFLKIGVLLLIVLFFGQTHFTKAAINHNEARSLVNDIYKANGIDTTNIGNEEVQIFQTSINNYGMIPDQAIIQTMQMRNKPVISTTFNTRQGVWNRSGNGNWQFIPSSNFTSIVLPQNRNIHFLRQVYNISPNTSVNNNVNTNNNTNTNVNNTDPFNITTRNGRTYMTINAREGQAQGQTNCGEEGLQGVDFLVFHGPLVPCGIDKQCAGGGSGSNEEARSINKTCTLCHFIILIKNIFDLLLSLIITVSLLMLTIAGVLYIISSGGAMTNMAKGIIEKTLLGFGIFLLSWLIVYTILNLLSVKENGMIGKGTADSWFQFTCDTESSFDKGLGEQHNPNTTNQHNPAPSPSITSTNGNEQDQAYRNMLIQQGIRINRTNHCTPSQQTGCTTIAGAREYTLNKISQLKLDDCPNCDIQVNGVTDKIINPDGTMTVNTTLHSSGGQYSHNNGYKVDYQATNSLNNHFIGVSNTSQALAIPNGQTSGILTRDGSRSGAHGGPKFTDREGNIYVLEGVTPEAQQAGVPTHWDVAYTAQ